MVREKDASRYQLRLELEDILREQRVDTRDIRNRDHYAYIFAGPISMHYPSYSYL